MKKLIAFALTLVLTVGIFAAAPVSWPLAARVDYGNANGDDVINAADALVALQAAVGKRALDETQFLCTDVDGSGDITASDALLILKYAVGKLDRFPADKGEPDDSQPEPSDVTSSESGSSDSSAPSGPDDQPALTMEEALAMQTLDAPATPIEDYYEIHADGGMIYNPLSREVDPADLTKYNVLPKTTGTLTLSDGSVLSYSVPTQVTAYDIVPVEYTLQSGSGSGPLYVEGTTFERGDYKYYDLCLPGTVNLQFDYLGYVSAENHGENRPFLSPRFNNDRVGTQYPQYDATDLIASDSVPSGKPVWFKFRMTNTGNTILDADGNGTFSLFPHLKDPYGNAVKDVANRHYRITQDLYPGESVELYIYFGDTNGMSLNAGNYNLVIDCLVRNERRANADNTLDWMTKIWDGYTYGTATKTITVSDAPDVVMNSAATYSRIASASVRDTWLHTYEEFTTSYDAWLSPAATQTGTLYVQPAAWSDHLALKLMRGNDLNMKSVNIPLTVDTNSISVTLNETAENYIITDEGTKYPAMASQTMCDMRVNDTLSPYSNEAQLKELLDMKECGINLVTTTEAFNIATNRTPSNAIKNNQDAIYFVSDALRKLGMRMEGYTGYPYTNATTISAAYWYSSDSRVRSVSTDGYSDPALDLANGLRGLYQFMRWGDNFYVNGKGKVIFNTEDTRGWMRIDINGRAQLGSGTVDNFRIWLQERYGTIAKLNAAWGTSYSAFSDVDPNAGSNQDINHPGWVQHKQGRAAMPEWSAALADLDIYRTLERTNNYAAVVDTLKNYHTYKDIGAASVNASMGIRTEGGNVTGVVPYDTPNSHLRHAYYSQRRAALIPEILAASGVVSMHSDYVTLPYSLAEWETLISTSTALGITSMPLLQSNRMRDIAINAKYGDTAYATHYNLSGDIIRGAYINTQTSVFQMFKVIYENGGIPGVLWEDYLCDGYVTETQQKEMKFFSQKIAQMMQSEEAQAWATRNVPDVQAIYATSNGVYSYDEAYIEAEIAKAVAARNP